MKKRFVFHRWVQNLALVAATITGYFGFWFAVSIVGGGR